MLFSRILPRRKNDKEKRNEIVKELEEFLETRDYSGAIALLEHKQNTEPSQHNALWLAYCAYHGGEYQKAAQTYENILKEKNYPYLISLYLCCAYMIGGQIDEAKRIAEKHEFQRSLMRDIALGNEPKNDLQNRLLLHLAHKAGDDKKTSYYHSLLTTSIEDQLCYAAINFMRGHYAEPMETYKTIITQHSNFLAINVYLGICYFKMDYFDEALACARAYLEKYPDSPTAINLEAACLYRIVSPKAADQCLKKLKNFAESDLSFAKDLILHNTVVFRNGETALQVLPALVDVVPEARKNLIIYYLKKNDVDLAFSHAEGLTSKTPTEYLLKALVYVMLGYEKKQDPNIGRAAQYFKVVAESKDEESRSLFSATHSTTENSIDTITGRLAMASYYFIIKDYHQAVIYYHSILQFNKDDDRFNFNYGQANLFAENYEEAADALSKVKDQRYTSYSTYQQGLVRAYIRSRQSARAWAFYTQNQSNPHSMSVLKIIANDCYKLEDYYYSAMAFDILSKKDPRNDIYSIPKQGSCLGVLKLFTTQRADKAQLATAFQILEGDRSAESQTLLLKARKWTNEATLLG